MYMDIEECLGVDILDLVDPWLQFSGFENGRKIAGWVGSHDRQGKCGKPRGKQVIHDLDVSVICQYTCLPHSLLSTG